MKKVLRTVRASIVGAAALALPLAAFAQGTSQNTTVTTIVLTIKNLMDLGIPILLVLALLYFFYGLAEYIFKAKDTEARTEGRERMIQGIIALFVMVSVWGLVRVIGNTFGVGQDSIGNVESIIPKAIQQQNPRLIPGNNPRGSGAFGN